MAAYKQPPKFDENSSYEAWSSEVKIWQNLTDLDITKQALAVTLSLTGRAHETAVRVPVDELNSNSGMQVLCTMLDKVLKKEDKDLAYETYTTFDNFKCCDGVTIGDYIYEFEKLYERCSRLKMVLPDAVLAFKLLDNANFTFQEKQLALTACNELTLSSMKSAMKRIFGDRPATGGNDEKSISIKEEGAFFVSGSKHRKQIHSPSSQQPVGTNPLNKFGKRTSCAICKSVFDWAKKCPHKPANVDLADSNEHDKNECQIETCNITLFTKDSHAMEVVFCRSKCCFYH